MSSRREGYEACDDHAVLSKLELRSPSNGTGTGETWEFSGGDERALRGCLDQLGAFATPPPLEVWDSHALRHVIRDDDRWRAAMLLWDDSAWDRGKVSFEPRRAAAAWTAAGAVELAALLPARLDDLRAAIRARF